MSESLLSTGKAAKLCSVTPDTLLKWVKSGRLAARRTAGGHYRIHRDDVQRLMSLGQRRPPNGNRQETERQFRYCWEYNGKGQLLDGCRECVVYEMRAQRCYEVVKLTPEIGHTKLFCKGSCLECDFFRRVREQATNVLVVTDNETLATSLKDDGKLSPYCLEVTDCEYKCSALVEVFRPDYVVIDCSLGPEASADICHHVIQDPRIPYVRVIMVGEEGEFPHGCDKEVFARIEKPFNVKDVADCIRGVGDVTI